MSRTGSLRAMPAVRRFELDELVTRPGTYFNPTTEIVLIVDDSASVDLELIEDDGDETADWILLGDDAEALLRDMEAAHPRELVVTALGHRLVEQRIGVGEARLVERDPRAVHVHHVAALANAGPLETGHYLAEEDPMGVLNAFERFFV